MLVLLLVASIGIGACCAVYVSFVGMLASSALLLTILLALDTREAVGVVGLALTLAVVQVAFVGFGWLVTRPRNQNA